MASRWSVGGVWLLALTIVACSSDTPASRPNLAIAANTVIGPGGQSVPCAFGETACGGVCISTASDAQNCGACGRLCGADQLCEQGSCRSVADGCSVGLLQCGQSCLNPNTDPSNCGSCGYACDPEQGVCQEGVCGCSDGLSVCEGSACVDLLSDSNHCGSCSTSCLPEQTCEQGVCTCPTGQTECDDACVDTGTSTAHCGTCGVACATTQICDSGTCVCPDSHTLCGESCVDLLADTAHCGGCGQGCLDGQVCAAGACACPDAQTECDGTCVDTTSDSDHCGVCGNACPEDQVCNGGECVCPDGQASCDGACIDTLADNLNCGACGNECAFGEGCSQGECSGGAEGEDGCVGVAQNIDLTEIAFYQTVKISVMSQGDEVGIDERISDVATARKTLVRAFVTPGAGWAPRTLSGRLFLKNPDSEMEVVYSNSTLMIQRESGEEERESTFEFNLEPEQITTETLYAMELVECEVGEGEVKTPRFPVDGAQELGARDTGGLKVHVVPLRLNNRLPATGEEDLQPYIDGFLAAYPISGIEITVGDPIDMSDDQDWNGMLNTVATLRQNENPGPEAYYYGMLQPTESIQEYCNRGCVAGVGFVPQGQFDAQQGRAAVGLAYGDEDSVLTMLHEVGHNHGREHSPCAPGGQIDGVDPNYPYSNGSVGVFGYDWRRDLITTAQNNSDVMGYCQNQWFSDYTYNGLMGEVIALNQTRASVAVPEARIGAWHVLLVDPNFGARWGIPSVGPTVASGAPETASVLDAFGNLVEQVTVYRTEVSDIDGFSIQVPEPQPGWHLISIDGVGPVVFQQTP